MIDVRGLGYAYPGSPHQALRGVDFHVGPGVVFGILGPAGAGKSTLMGILAGSLRDYAGSVRYLDREYPDWNREFYERVGISRERPGLFETLTARTNLASIRRLYRGGKGSVSDLLERIGLSSQADWPARKLDPGMRKRLSLGLALVHDPECLIADEPTAGLDAGEIEIVRRLLLDRKQAGKSVVMATADANLLAGLCDRWIPLRDGRAGTESIRGGA
ncbi:MAG: transporter ATP-binding protein [Fibrobacteres bacterium]|nr:transporter ATP-binding protein [Fibrobacterota bacterium]